MSGVNCVGYGSFTVTDTGCTLPASVAIPARAKGVVMTIETNAVRLRMDGTAADTGVGNGDLLNSGDVYTMDSWTHPGTNWRSVMLAATFAADATGTTGRVSVHFYD